MVFVLYLLFGYSLKLSFFTFGDNLFFDYLDYSCDLFFVLDMAVIFFQPLITRTKYCVTFRSIALNYLRFWFWVDLISSIPFGIILGNQENPDLTSTRFRVIFEIPRLYKLLRMFKLVKITRLLRYRNRAVILNYLKGLESHSNMMVSVAPIFTIGVCAT